MLSSGYYRLIDQTVGIEDCDPGLLYGREVGAGHEQRSTTTQVALQRVDPPDCRVFGVLKRIHKRMIRPINA